MEYIEADFTTKLKKLRKTSIINGFWVSAFLSFPTLAIRHLRFNIGQLHVPIFIVILFIIVLLNIVGLSIANKPVRAGSSKTQKLFLLTFCLLVILHFINAFRAIDTERTISQLIKLFTAFVAFAGVLVFFPRDREFLRRIVDLIIITSTILLVAYCYRYIFVFKSVFLGIDWTMHTISGRGQMGVWLTLIMPVVIWKWLRKGISSIWIIPVAVHFFALVYSLSRAAWVSLVLGQMIFFAMLVNRKRERRNLILMIVVSLLIAIIAYSIYSMQVFSRIKQTYAFHERIQTLFSMSDAEGERSISLREDLARKSVDEFLKNPILGIGTSNFIAIHDIITHDDYLEILCEQGLVGLSLFLFMFFLVVHKIYKLENDSWEVIGLKNSILAILIHMLFSDIYKMAIFYVFVGLFLSISKSISIIKDYDEDSTYRASES